MRYVLRHKETKQLYTGKNKVSPKIYETRGNAQSALTHIVRYGRGLSISQEEVQNRLRTNIDYNKVNDAYMEWLKSPQDRSHLEEFYRINAEYNSKRSSMLQQFRKDLCIWEITEYSDIR